LHREAVELYKIVDQGEVVMEANDLDALKYCQYLWEEYRYRHDHIWQRIFRFTTAVVLISIIPYVQQTIAGLLGAWILIAPTLATILAVFVLVVMRNELELFGRIKTAYRRQQNTLLDDDLKHDLGKKSDFNRLVMFYLSSLAVLSLANGWIAFCVWLPRVSVMPIC
jgi:hypothetical protein